ncbi:MAG TPA: hypothetical protein PKY77_23825 [Phycisphaerae bacterium]|nr:hypothetical protein [Phycisphaerae bacterium]HRY71340.1 hypothetical protein [Phycisphaerae bacterium]HSA29794.1 hypothetical protein [Phycisphaerae bacterium]
MAASKKAWRRRVGRVTVYQRGGRLWIYYRDYKPVRRPAGTSREEALALAAKINAQLADGTLTMLAFIVGVKPRSTTLFSVFGCCF